VGVSPCFWSLVLNEDKQVVAVATGDAEVVIEIRSVQKSAGVFSCFDWDWAHVEGVELDLDTHRPVDGEGRLDAIGHFQERQDLNRLAILNGTLVEGNDLVDRTLGSKERRPAPAENGVRGRVH